MIMVLSQDCPCKALYLGGGIYVRPLLLGQVTQMLDNSARIERRRGFTGEVLAPELVALVGTVLGIRGLSVNPFKLDSASSPDLFSLVRWQLSRSDVPFLYGRVPAVPGACGIVSS